MQIHISANDGVPIYLQIVNQVKYLAASGLIKPGEELPPIRTLALQLKVTPNTIVKAYHELEISGVVQKRQGSGTFISDARPQLALRQRQPRHRAPLPDGCVPNGTGCRDSHRTRCRCSA